MKKKVIKGIAVALALTAVLLLILRFSSCPRMTASDTIKSYSFFSGEYFELPIKNRHSESIDVRMDGSILFTSKLSIDEMLEEIKASNAGCTAEKVNGKIFITVKRDGALDYFLIYAFSSEYYEFTAMRSLILIDVSENGQRTTRTMLMPLHFITDERQSKNTGDNPFYINTEYETSAGIDAYYQFYKNSGYYNVTKEGSTLTVSGLTEKALACDESLEGAKDFAKPLIFEFTRNLDKAYFTVREG